MSRPGRQVQDRRQRGHLHAILQLRTEAARQKQTRSKTARDDARQPADRWHRLREACEYVAGDCLPALALPWPSAGEDGKPQGGFQRRRAKAPVRPRQRVRIDQVVSRRRTVPGACGRRARNPAADLRRHAVGKVLLALNRMPQVMGNEFRGQRFRRRPGGGRSRCEPAPGLDSRAP